jgi:periplasmic protein TonB
LPDAGNTTLLVQFIVDKEGIVSDVQAVSGPEVLRKEAERVIKKSGKWEPAIQNGRKVSSYKSQPIVVLLNE